MKKIVAGILLFIAGFAIAESQSKLWVNNEYQENGDRILFIQDRETGTRCYAITSSKVTVSGYAISCVR